MIRFLFTLFFAAFPFFAYAHPGHGSEEISGTSFLHFITTPEHAIWIIFAFIVGLFLVLKFRQRDSSDL